MNKPDAVAKSIPVLEKYSQGSNTDFKLILARLYAENKDYDKAFNLYKEIDESKNTQGIQLYNFAQMLYSANSFDEASKVYNEIISLFPNSPILPNVRLGYAKTLEAMLDKEESGNSSAWKPFFKPVLQNTSEAKKVKDAYLELTKSYPNTDVAMESFLRIADLDLHNLGNVDEAKNYLNEIIKNAGNSNYASDAYMKLAKIELMSGNLTQTESYYNDVISNKNYSQNQRNSADYRLARLMFCKGDFEKAKNKLNGILNNLKDNTANDALELSLIMNTSRGDSSNLAAFASAELLAEQGKFEDAEKKYKLVAADPQKFMLQNLAMFRQAQMELALNNYDTTIILLKRIAGENEKNIYADKALYLLGKIYQFGVKDKSKAMEIYENLLAKFPNSLYLDEARAQIIKLRDKLS